MEEAIERYAEEHDYENWQFKDLVQLCKDRGLKCTRTKVDLILRLVKDDTKLLLRVREYRDKYGDDFSRVNRDKWLNRIDLNNMGKAELVVQCNSRSINVSGDIKTIRRNITEYDKDIFERMKNFRDSYM